MKYILGLLILVNMRIQAADEGGQAELKQLYAVKQPKRDSFWGTIELHELEEAEQQLKDKNDPAAIAEKKALGLLIKAARSEKRRLQDLKDQDSPSLPVQADTTDVYMINEALEIARALFAGKRGVTRVDLAQCRATKPYRKKFDENQTKAQLLRTTLLVKFDQDTAVSLMETMQEMQNSINDLTKCLGHSGMHKDCGECRIINSYKTGLYGLMDTKYTAWRNQLGELGLVKSEEGDVF